MQCNKLHSLIAAFLLGFGLASSLLAQELSPEFGTPAPYVPPRETKAPEFPASAFELDPLSGLPAQRYERRNESPGVEDSSLDVRELVVPPLLSETIDLTAPTDDLWQRMRNGFCMPGLNNELVLKQQQWYLNHPDYLRRVVERGRPYIHHIVEELEKRGMPTELALLPIVESAFDPSAYSRAKASGLWQFIPSTGKRFELKQNWWHDQRRDILASTEAALEYLQSIYEMHGDWHLALASYNWGEGAVQRAIQKNAAKGLPTDYSSLTLPEETRQYVPKLIALKNIFSSAATLAELGIPVIPNRPYFATVQTGKPIDIHLAARLAGIPVDEFIKLNPAHNRPVISGEAMLVIPAEKLESFQNNLNNHSAPLTKWQLYTAKSAERLDRLAPRFGISLADLKRVNGIKGGISISAGTSLLVPARGNEGLKSTPEQIKPPDSVPERHLKKPARSGKNAAKPRHGKHAAKPAKPSKRAAGTVPRKPGRSKRVGR